mgnify:CR=1 FL=1
MSNYNPYNGASRNGKSRFNYAGFDIAMHPVSTGEPVDHDHGTGQSDSLFVGDDVDDDRRQGRQIIDLDTGRTRSLPNTWGGA